MERKETISDSVVPNSLLGSKFLTAIAMRTSDGIGGLGNTLSRFGLNVDTSSSGLINISVMHWLVTD